MVLIESVGTGKNGFSVKQINPVTVAQSNAYQRSIAPSSSQIKAGTDNKNNPLGKYKVVQFTTDTSGFGQIVFKDLK